MIKITMDSIIVQTYIIRGINDYVNTFKFTDIILYFMKRMGIFII